VTAFAHATYNGSTAICDGRTLVRKDDSRILELANLPLCPRCVDLIEHQRRERHRQRSARTGGGP
jgi:hypothetical protein